MRAKPSRKARSTWCSTIPVSTPPISRMWSKAASKRRRPEMDHASHAEKEVLNVKGLSAGYGPMRVIHDLDLIVYSGERVGLVGLNGHGKSTWFRAMAGLTGWP